MIARLVFWSLAETAADLDDLRDAVDEGGETPSGRRFVAFVSDESSERFGEFSIWDSVEDSELAGPGRIGEVAGRAPDLWEHFDLEGWEGRL